MMTQRNLKWHNGRLKRVIEFFMNSVITTYLVIWLDAMKCHQRKLWNENTQSWEKWTSFLVRYGHLEGLCFRKIDALLETNRFTGTLSSTYTKVLEMIHRSVNVQYIPTTFVLRFAINIFSHSQTIVALIDETIKVDICHTLHQLSTSWNQMITWEENMETSLLGPQ